MEILQAGVPLVLPVDHAEMRRLTDQHELKHTANINKALTIRERESTNQNF